MKIYISGKISGLPLSEVRQRFADTAAFLDSIGFEAVNPMNNGVSPKADWKEHMAADIRMLLDCQTIYMMDNWIDSKGASIEYDIANRLGMNIWFETIVKRENIAIMRIQNAIHEVTGLRFNQYATESRKKELFFARMIFVYHCRKLKMSMVQIAKYVNRHHSSILYFLRKYEDDFKFNYQFRQLAIKVDQILNPKSKR